MNIVRRNPLDFGLSRDLTEFIDERREADGEERVEPGFVLREVREALCVKAYSWCMAMEVEKMALVVFFGFSEMRRWRLIGNRDLQLSPWSGIGDRLNQILD